uniref:Putative tail tubular protein n=1 Tax=viral metagenome TaxID=1070528 RepID=A0A6M3IYH1_9ZZZZ
MAKIDVIKTSFVGGEFGSSLFGRTDVAQYANACEIVENFLVRPYGSAISRPGSRYVAEVKDSTKETRLIKFVFNQADAYTIEMGEYYFRFFTNGAVVVTSGTTPYEIAHIYDEDEIWDVQFTQLNDIIWLTHPDHPPQRLIRYAAALWTCTEFAILGGPFLDDNTDETILLNVSATTGTINLVFSPTGSGIFVVSTSSTKGHLNTYWKIGVTVTNATTGIEEQGYVEITRVVNTYTATASVIKLLSTSGTTSIWAEGAWSDVRGYPYAVNFHERRLWFASTDYEPNKVWGSKSFLFDDFALDAADDDDGINIQLASNESNEIQWLASGKSLLAGTYGGVFVINSGSTDPITPSNVNATEEVSFGSQPVPPKKIGNFLYYAQRFGKKLRELFYSWDLDTFKSIDKTVLSPHILGDGIWEMDYQQNPDTILWCLRTDGVIATLTREVDQEVQGWSRQTTNGSYCSIAIIPSQTSDYDEVWSIVQRRITPTGGTTTVKRYVEVFEAIEIPERQDLCLYLDSALTYNAFTANTTATISLSATTGTITVTSSTAYFTAADVTRRIRAINADGDIVGELYITSYGSTTLVKGTSRYNFNATSYAAGSWGKSVKTITGLTHLETCSTTVLADGGTDKPAKTVTSGSITLAYDYFVVSVGLSYDQIIYTLPFEAGSERGTSQGKVQRINELAFKVNRSHKGFYAGGTEDELDIVSYIESTTEEILYTGTIPNPDFVLTRVSFRDPATPMGTPEVLFTGIIPNISFRDNYRYGSQVYIKNSDPLPMEILSIIATLTTYDK